MELKIYPLLNSKSQQAMLRTKRKYGKKWGHPYYYEPRGDLLKKLSVELQMSKSKVREQIIEEREYLLTNPGKA